MLQLPTGGHNWKKVHTLVPDPDGFVVPCPGAVDAVDTVLAVVIAVVLVVTGVPAVELPGLPPPTPV